MDLEIIGEDFIDFKCPHCNALNSFTTSAARHVRECVNCMEAFLVPEADGGAARIIPLQLETQNIRLRRFEPADWEQLLEFRFEDEDEATGWLLRNSKVRITEVRQTFSLAIETRESSKIIGSLGLSFTDPELNQMELSLSFREGTPQASQLEAFDAALDFCFQDLHLHRIVVQCGADDQESLQLLKDAGLRKEGEFVKHYYIHGQWLSTAWFALLEEEYSATTKTS